MTDDKILDTLFDISIGMLCAIGFVIFLVLFGMIVYAAYRIIRWIYEVFL
jgi:hypothetical protein